MNEHEPGRPARRASKPPAKPAERVARILEILEKEHKDARCALDWERPFHLAVATILSAQCTDERVNKVTPALFARFPDALELSRASLGEVEEIIRSTGFFRAKARSIVGFAAGIASRPQRDLPRSIAELVKLPGIGRKTANVVLGHAFGINEGIAVDTHVLRVSNRLGLARGHDPVDVERQLLAIVPVDQRTRITDLLIFHGRRFCDARKPACSRCALFALCTWPEKESSALLSPPSRRRKAAKPAPARVRRER